MAHESAKAKNKSGIKSHMYTLVHACKIKAPHTHTHTHTHTYPYKVSATKQSSLQPVVP